METFYSEQEVVAIEEEAGVIIELSKKKGDEMLAQARAQSTQMLDQAKQDGEQIRAQAQTSGYQQGLQIASDQIHGEMDQVVAALNQLKQVLDKNLEEVFRSIEGQVMEMVLEIARKVVGYEVTMNKELILETISKCLAKTRERNSIVIKVNKNDFEMAESKKEVFLKKIRGLKGIEIEESELVFEGGCIIETSIGDVNGDIDEQFHKIQDALISE